jgi:hypothetical protein
MKALRDLLLIILACIALGWLSIQLFGGTNYNQPTNCSPGQFGAEC